MADWFTLVRLIKVGKLGLPPSYWRRCWRVPFVLITLFSMVQAAQSPSFLSKLYQQPLFFVFYPFWITTLYHRSFCSQKTINFLSLFKQKLIFSSDFPTVPKQKNVKRKKYNYLILFLKITFFIFITNTTIFVCFLRFNII